MYALDIVKRKEDDKAFYETVQEEINKTPKENGILLLGEVITGNILGLFWVASKLF